MRTRRSALKLHDRAAYGSGASALSYRASVVNSANRCTCRESGWIVTSGLPDSRSVPDAYTTTPAGRGDAVHRPHGERRERRAGD